MSENRLTREVVSPPRSLARPTFAALIGCALLLLGTQQCAGRVRAKLDAVVQFGTSMGPAPDRSAR